MTSYEVLDPALRKEPFWNTAQELFAGARAVPVALGLTPKLQALRAQSDGETKAVCHGDPCGSYYLIDWGLLHYYMILEFYMVHGCWFLFS